MVNFIMSDLINLSYKYNENGTADLLFEYKQYSEDIQIRPGDYIRLIYIDTDFEMKQNDVTITKLTYDFVPSDKKNRKFLFVGFRLEDGTNKSIVISSLLKIIQLNNSMLLKGEEISDDVIIAYNTKNTKNPVNKTLFYIQAKTLTAANGQVLNKGLYRYMDGTYIPAKSLSETANKSLGNYRILDTIEERDSLAPYDGLMVSILENIEINTLEQGTRVKGIKFANSTNNLEDGILISFEDETKNIIAYAGCIYYKTRDGVNIDDTSVLIMDHGKYIGLNNGILWFSSMMSIKSVEYRNAVFVGIIVDLNTYRYENGEWKLFEPAGDINTVQGIKSAILTYESRDVFPNIGDNRYLYMDDTNNKLYRWASSSLSYKGVGEPAEVTPVDPGEMNQNAFSYIKAGTATIGATNTMDTFEIAAGKNVELSVNGKIITINVDDLTVDLSGLDTKYAAKSIETTAKNALPKSGGIMTGSLVLDHNPILDMEAVTKAYVEAKLGSLDAMVMKGVLDSTHPLPIRDYANGWTWKVGEAGTYAGEACAQLDLVICTETFSSVFNNSDFMIIHVNSDGSVNSIVTAGEAIPDEVVTFADSTGKNIKGSGFTIGKSVPKDAVFTDTTYEVATETTNGLASKEMVKKLNGVEEGANKYIHPTGAGSEHVPAGGSDGQALIRKADGSLSWAKAAGEVDIATATKAGIVKSSGNDNQIIVGSNGSMEVNNLTLDKLKVKEADKIIINGGNAQS